MEDVEKLGIRLRGCMWTSGNVEVLVRFRWLKGVQLIGDDDRDSCVFVRGLHSCPETVLKCRWPGENGMNDNGERRSSRDSFSTYSYSDVYWVPKVLSHASAIAAQ
jgi:hypothetical protein